MTHPLEQRIDVLRHRLRRLLVVYGVSWMVAAALAAVIALGLTDYVFRFRDRGIRLVFSLAVVGVVGWACYRYLLMGLSTWLSDVELARRLQRRFPRLSDVLASAVQFLGQSEDDPTAGSVALRRSVIAQATADAEPLDFRHVLDRRPVVRVALASSALCMVALALVLLDPLHSRIAVARLVNPFGGEPWPQKNHLELVEAVTRVAKGQVFEIEVVDRNGVRLPEEVRVHYQFENPDGSLTEEIEPMRFVDGAIAARRTNGTTDPRRQDGMMVARRENVSRPFSYRVDGGDDDSMPWIPVEVLEPPSLDSITVELTPPQYTGWPMEKASGHVHALVGTRAAIRGKSSKPLESAVLCFEDGQEVEARLTDSSRELAAEFTVEQSGAYWFRLTDVEGLSGGDDARWEIRAVPDAPPSVSIERPVADAFVTPQAELLVRISAKDDLAVHRVDLHFQRSDRPDESQPPLPIHVGPDRVEPESVGLSGGAELGRKLALPPYQWELSKLGLEPGTVVTFHASATDYRPGTGQSQTRRLTVITHHELAQRIAARQTAVLSELERVLDLQTKIRRQVADIELRLTEVGRLDRSDLIHLRGAEFNQRHVRSTLTSPSEGVPAQIRGLLADLENNKVDSRDVRRRMNGLLDAIDALDREQLPNVQRQLTSANKAAQAGLQGKPPAASPPEPSKPDPNVARPLSAAAADQDQVIAALEQMLDQLGRWDRYRRFHAKIAQLLHDQEELTGDTKKLGQRTLTKNPEDLLPQESADLKILARRQFDLAHDLEKTQQEMDRAATDLTESNPLVAETISDALHRARELGVSARMGSAGGRIRRNQMGQAIQDQQEVVRNLKEILDILANRGEHELTRLIKQLLEAESKLADLARQQEGLRKQIEGLEGQPDDAERRRQLERLRRRQQELEEEARRTARRLERLLARSASEKTSEAAREMHEAARRMEQGDRQGASARAESARDRLEEARRQVAQRRREAETELATEQMARLEQMLQALRKHEDKILAETQRLDRLAAEQGRLTRAQTTTLYALARDQRSLQNDTDTLIDKLIGADVFRLALSHVAEQMGLAAGLLDRRQTGAPTQQAEVAALGRLDQLLEALQPEKPDEDSESSGGGADGQGPSPQAPPGGIALTMAELKLLKLMQQDVNRQTDELETAFAAAELNDEARRRYADLSREQGRLAELLYDLMRPKEDPEQNPDALPSLGPDPEPSREESDALMLFDEEDES
ncbi:MAG: DUF4175 family protein [Planctomycetota bacterium]|jgi:hypothetical protein